MWLAAPFDSTFLQMSTPAILTRYTWKEKTKPRSSRWRLWGALGHWRVKEFCQETPWGQQLDPSGAFLLGEGPEARCRWVLHVKERVQTPCCLHSPIPAAPRTCSPGAAMECGFVPVTLEFRGKFNCTAHVPHTACRTGVLFYCN